MAGLKSFLQGFFFAFISIGAIPFLMVQSFLEQL
jgi:hypothetical protein